MTVSEHWFLSCCLTLCRSAQSPDAASDIPDLETDESDDEDSDGEYDRYRRCHHRPNRPNRNWQIAINYHIDAIIEGTTPLLLAIRAGNVKLAKSLLQAGADPLTVCAAAAACSSTKKSDSSSKSSSSISSWTTPLHLAVEMKQVKLLQYMAAGLADRPEILRPKPFATPKIPVVNHNDDVKPHTPRDVTIYNNAGETPLTLAVRLKFYNAAVALLGAGFNPCQVVSVYVPGSDKDEHTHALMMSVKVGLGGAAYYPSLFDALTCLHLPLCMLATTAATAGPEMCCWLCDPMTSQIRLLPLYHPTGCFRGRQHRWCFRHAGYLPAAAAETYT